MAPWRSTFTIGLTTGLVSCAGAAAVVTPLPAPVAACPIDGCAGRASPSAPLPAAPVCPAAGEAPCGGASGPECTQHALAAWSDAQDDRAVGCVARMLGQACILGDAHACAFAGRMWLDGRGVARDVQRGMDLLMRACDGGVSLGCVVGARWLGDSVHARDLPDAADRSARFEVEHGCLTGEPQVCFQLGLSFYFGRDGFPRDRVRAVEAYQRGCDFGTAIACNNLGDALAYGDGVARDVVRSARMFDKACRLGEAMGCANSGYMLEHGEGISGDRARARELYREACVSGEVYGCLHAEMLAAQDAGAPRDSLRALSHWRRACARADARACAFVGVIYEDGPDGLARDSDKSLEAMNRACGLGDVRACEWVKQHSQQ